MNTSTQNSARPFNMLLISASVITALSNTAFAQEIDEGANEAERI